MWFFGKGSGDSGKKSNESADQQSNKALGQKSKESPGQKSEGSLGQKSDENSGQKIDKVSQLKSTTREGPGEEGPGKKTDEVSPRKSEEISPVQSTTSQRPGEGIPSKETDAISAQKSEELTPAPSATCQSPGKQQDKKLDQKPDKISLSQSVAGSKLAEETPVQKLEGSSGQKLDKSSGGEIDKLPPSPSAASRDPKLKLPTKMPNIPTLPKMPSLSKFPKMPNVPDIKINLSNINQRTIMDTVHNLIKMWNGPHKPHGPRVHMKYPYTLSAKIAQFPYKFYYENNWIARWYPVGIVVCLPLFMYFSSLANSKENIAKWKEIRRKDYEHYKEKFYYN